MEAMSEDTRPRVNAEARDDKGNTLLGIAAWHGRAELVELLLTKHKEYHPSLEELERTLTMMCVIKPAECVHSQVKDMEL